MLQLLCRPCVATRVTSVFNPKRVHPITKKIVPHNGVDLSPVKKVHENIYATHQGVCEVGFNNSAGNFVRVWHGNDFTFYCHLSKVLVKKNDLVNAGFVIGCMGTTGGSTGEHLHFGVKLNGRWVDPQPLLVGVPTAIELKESEEEMVTNATFLINGKQVVVKRILKNGVNFVELRDLSSVLDIDYDVQEKLVKIEPKKTVK